MHHDNPMTTPTEYDDEGRHEMYYITDDCGFRMRDSKDSIFTCATLDECEDVLSFYFDMSYGDVFRVYDANDDLIRTYLHNYDTCETEVITA